MSLVRDIARRRWLVAALAGAAGLALTITAMVALDGRFAAPPKPERQAVSFDVLDPPEPPKQAPVRKRRPKKTKPKAPPPRALAANLAGLDAGFFGMSSDLGDATDALLGDVGDVVMTSETVDTAPVPLTRAAIQFPPRARAQGISGHVTLSLLIDTTGAVSDARVLESDPPGVFDAAALEGIRQWRFQPATYQGQTVATRAQQTLNFALE